MPLPARLTALVTNIGHFIGAPAAATLAARPNVSRVFVHDKDGPNVDDVREHLEQIGDVDVDAAAAKIHLLSSRDVADAAHEAMEGGASIDCVVSNDFYPAVRVPIEDAASDASVAAVREGLEALAVDPYRLCAAVAPGMKERGCGRIVVLGSSSCVKGISNYTVSCNDGNAVKPCLFLLLLCAPL